MKFGTKNYINYKGCEMLQKPYQTNTTALHAVIYYNLHVVNGWYWVNGLIDWIESYTLSPIFQPCDVGLGERARAALTWYWGLWCTHCGFC